MIQANSLLLNLQVKSPCYLVTLSLESSDFQTFLKQYVILVPFGALIHIVIVLVYFIHYYCCMFACLSLVMQTNQRCDSQKDYVH